MACVMYYVIGIWIGLKKPGTRSEARTWVEKSRGEKGRCGDMLLMVGREQFPPVRRKFGDVIVRRLPFWGCLSVFSEE